MAVFYVSYHLSLVFCACYLIAAWIYRSMIDAIATVTVGTQKITIEFQVIRRG
jgi:hypothetical protein